MLLFTETTCLSSQHIPDPFKISLSNYPLMWRLQSPNWPLYIQFHLLHLQGGHHVAIYLFTGDLMHICGLALLYMGRVVFCFILTVPFMMPTCSHIHSSCATTEFTFPLLEYCLDWLSHLGPYCFPFWLCCCLIFWLLICNVPFSPAEGALSLFLPLTAYVWMGLRISPAYLLDVVLLDYIFSLQEWVGLLLGEDSIPQIYSTSGWLWLCLFTFLQGLFLIFICPFFSHWCSDNIMYK